MDDEKRNNTRLIVAIAGIAAFCLITLFVAAAILLLKRDTETVAAAPITVSDQTVYIYPDPAMSVKVVSEQAESSPSGEVSPVPIVTLPPDVIARATAQVGTGGEPTPTVTPPPAATLPPPPPPPTPVPPSVVVVTYVVVAGDNLYRLTQKYNTSIDLMASYDIAASDMIVGKVLALPIANSAFCPGSRPHVVRDQQTVSQIARIYNTTPQAIGAANGLDANYSVKTTQVICVPY
jgi:LysM repeat protein